MKWTEPDEEGLVAFLCGDKQFSEERVRNGTKKLVKAKNTGTQGRLDSFFTVLPSTNNSNKRKVSCLIYFFLYFSNINIILIGWSFFSRLMIKKVPGKLLLKEEKLQVVEGVENLNEINFTNWK